MSLVEGAPVEILKHCRHARCVLVDSTGYPSSGPTLYGLKFIYVVITQWRHTLAVGGQGFSMLFISGPCRENLVFDLPLW